MPNPFEVAGHTSVALALLKAPGAPIEVGVVAIGVEGLMRSIDDRVWHQPAADALNRHYQKIAVSGDMLKRRERSAIAKAEGFS